MYLLEEINSVIAMLQADNVSHKEMEIILLKIIEVQDIANFLTNFCNKIENMENLIILMKNLLILATYTTKESLTDFIIGKLVVKIENTIGYQKSIPIYITPLQDDEYSLMGDYPMIYLESITTSDAIETFRTILNNKNDLIDFSKGFIEEKIKELEILKKEREKLEKGEIKTPIKFILYGKEVDFEKINPLSKKNILKNRKIINTIITNLSGLEFSDELPVELSIEEMKKVIDWQHPELPNFPENKYGDVGLVSLQDEIVYNIVEEKLETEYNILIDYFDDCCEDTFDIYTFYGFERKIVKNICNKILNECGLIERK